MVAENSRVRRSAGVASRISSRSSRKPMSSISSASSSTTARSADRSSAPRSRWSRSRPGVPTTMCAPPCQGAALLHRVHAADAGGDPRAGLGVEPVSSRLTWMRELAGRRDRPAPAGSRARRAARRRRAAAGAMARPKATVLPEPVWAETSRSRPSASSARGRRPGPGSACHSRARRALRRAPHGVGHVACGSLAARGCVSHPRVIAALLICVSAASGRCPS